MRGLLTFAFESFINFTIGFINDFYLHYDMLKLTTSATCDYLRIQLIECKAIHHKRFCLKIVV
jgi:hypothetical protein